MSWFKRIFKDKERSVEDSVKWYLSIALKNADIDFSISEFEGLGDTVYSKQVHRDAKKAVENKDIDYLKSLTGADVTNDLITTYILKSESGKRILVAFFDPFELYENASVIAVNYDI